MSSFYLIKNTEREQCIPIPERMTLLSRFFLVNQPHTAIPRRSTLLN